MAGAVGNLLVATSLRLADGPARAAGPNLGPQSSLAPHAGQGRQGELQTIMPFLKPDKAGSLDVKPRRVERMPRNPTIIPESKLGPRSHSG
jgi:hypothetical protein